MTIEMFAKKEVELLPTIAVSLWQPWACFLVEKLDGSIHTNREGKEFWRGLKSIETRSWKPSVDKFPLVMFIHAGMMNDEKAFKYFNMPLDLFGQYFHHGALIGTVEVYGFQEYNYSSWKDDRKYHQCWWDFDSKVKYGWLMRNPVKFKKPIPYRGGQKIFKIDFEKNPLREDWYGADRPDYDKDS